MLKDLEVDCWGHSKPGSWLSTLVPTQATALIQGPLGCDPPGLDSLNGAIWPRSFPRELLEPYCFLLEGQKSSDPKNESTWLAKHSLYTSWEVGQS